MVLLPLITKAYSAHALKAHHTKSTWRRAKDILPTHLRDIMDPPWIARIGKINVVKEYDFIEFGKCLMMFLFLASFRILSEQRTKTKHSYSFQFI